MLVDNTASTQWGSNQRVCWLVRGAAPPTIRSSCLGTTRKGQLDRFGSIPLQRSALPSCSVRADASAVQPLTRVPRTVWPGRRVNIARREIRRACTVYSAEARVTTADLQLSATCCPPFAAVALRQWVKLSWQRCARSWAAALDGVLCETTHDWCGLSKRRPCGLAPAFVALDYVRDDCLSN